MNDNLRNDRDVVTAAVTNTELALQYIGATLRNDQLVWRISSIRSVGLEFANEALKDNRDVVICAATGSQNDAALQIASNELRNDAKIVRSVKEASRKCFLSKACPKYDFDEPICLLNIGATERLFCT